MTTRTIDLEAAVAEVEASPADHGIVELIAVRPAENERTVVKQVILSAETGVVGDNWLERVTAKAGSDGAISNDAQITLMNCGFAQAITPDGSGWELAGDQFYVEFDLSVANAPPGSRLALGEAVIEISEAPHTGCAKFAARFGRETLKATQTDEGKSLRLRGVNASVVEGGTVRRGDTIRKL